VSRRGALAVAALLLAGACGGSSDTATPDPTTSSTTTSTTTTTTTTIPPPPGGRRPTEARPLRVLLAGDSLMADVAPALTSALHDGGHARVRFVAAPSIPRQPVYHALWEQQLARYDPEVIVVMVGVWEGIGEATLTPHPMGSPPWQQAYRSRLLEPYLRLLGSEGARVAWIGMPAVPSVERSLAFAAIDGVLARVARQRPELLAHYVPGDRLLAGADGRWTDVLPGPAGNPQRVRRLDTTHLCPDGAVRLALPVLRWIEQQWEVPSAHGWPTAAWRNLFPPEDCPPPA
jgi:hypothetical protein